MALKNILKPGAKDLVEAAQDFMFRFASGLRKAHDEDRPEPEPRKGIWRFLNTVTNKKQQRVFQLNAATLKRLANSDPVTWSIRRTIKSLVSQAEWDIVVDTEKAEGELDRWEDIALSYISPYAVSNDPVLNFKTHYIEPKLAKDTTSKLKEIYEMPLADAEKRKAVRWCFDSAARQVKEVAEGHREPVRVLFERPSTQGIESNWRALQELVLEDLLMYDAGVIVKNYNHDGELAELYTLPGHEIRLYRNEDRTIPQAPEAAYVWEDAGVIRAEFTWDELIYIMQNPQVNGYGMSPLEVASHVIVAGIYADEFNIDYFKNSNVPPGVFNLGEEITEDQRIAFRQAWENEVRGRGALHRMMFISGTKNPSFIPFREQSNRDMQMMEYVKWTTGVKCMAYGLSPQDIGLVMDFHRTTAEEQSKLTQARGVKNVLHLLKQYYNEEIVKEEFDFSDVKFDYTNLDATDEKKSAEIDQIDIQNGVIDRNERRKKLGLKPRDGGDKLTVQGQVTPLEQIEAQDPMLEGAGGAGFGAPQGQVSRFPGGLPGGARPGQEPPVVGAPSANLPPAGEGQPEVGKPVEALSKPVVKLSINRRKPMEKQREMMDGVVNELKNKGVDAEIRIGFDDAQV